MRKLYLSFQFAPLTRMCVGACVLMNLGAKNLMNDAGVISADVSLV